ncbi:uncharacterized protein LOC141850578 [Brevipalpus obovatus]|uniref:uncharacterized protein LOC141850578 n=1 Tax=Brevipalpus obovatus TaxID=246614 RepID=UPI003D9F8122
MVITSLEPLLESITQFFNRFGKEYLFVQTPTDNKKRFYCVCYTDGQDDNGANFLIKLLRKRKECQIDRPLGQCSYTGKPYSGGIFAYPAIKLLISHYLDFHPGKFAEFFWYIVRESNDLLMKEDASKILLSWREREEERSLEIYDHISGMSQEDLEMLKDQANSNLIDAKNTLNIIPLEPENITSHVDVNNMINNDDDSNPLLDDAEMVDQGFPANFSDRKNDGQMGGYGGGTKREYNDRFSSPGKVKVARPSNFPSRDGSNFARPGPSGYGRDPLNQRSTQPPISGYSPGMRSSEDMTRQRMNQQTSFKGNDTFGQDRGASSFSRASTAVYSPRQNQHKQGPYQ